ncbi:MAG: CotH kinase family protein [Crocinitomicaceae bacterium]|nr:CotH kinase family protein [Crocinitomicaceae bacterium]
MRFRIDIFFVFLVLCNAFLFLAFGTKVIGLGENQKPSIIRYVALENIVDIPQQGQFDTEASIWNLHPGMVMYYSLDGGDHFVKADQVIDFKKLKNKDNLLLPTSYHWKRATGDFPQALSIVLKAESTDKKVATNEKVLSYFDVTAHDMPVICLSSRHDDLFSDEKGIFVFGQSAWNEEGFYVNWWNRSANFQNRGNAWERDATIQYFNQGSLVFEQNGSMKISGNATRGFPQKSMQLIATRTDGSAIFEYPFFGKYGVKKYSSLTLRNSGNDNNKTLFADLLMQKFAAESNLTTQQGIPVVVYLNGNYWGIYNMRERIDEFLIAEKEDVKPEEVTILEGGSIKLKDGDEAVHEDFKMLIEKINQNGFNRHDELYNELSEQIDLNSFSDYIFFETFYANSDWPYNNCMWYKAGEKKWKWILNDLDYGLAYLGDGAVESNLFDKLKNTSGAISDLFNFLIKQPDFNKSFKQNCENKIQTIFNSEYIQSTYAIMQSLYANEMDRHCRRWRMIQHVEEWENNCEKNLNFLLKRGEVYLKQVAELL